MANVIVDKTKLDYLANAIANKSGESVPLTLSEMVSAVDGIETGGGGITPTGNINITSAGVTDVTNYATATVPEAEPYVGAAYGYYTESGSLKFRFRGEATFDDGEQKGWLGQNQYGNYVVRNAIATGTSVTPTESSQTIGGVNTMLEGAITVNAIPSNYVGSGITQRTSSDLSASGATVTAPAGYYASAATKTISSGSATASATKGTVTNHSVTVTPSVTRTAGYITAGSANGTAVTVSASELVSGTKSITANGTGIDVTNYASVDVAVSGGGGVSNFTLLGTQSVGTVTTNQNTNTDTGVSITVKGVYAYDMLVCECSVDTKTNGRHAATVRQFLITNSSDISTKNSVTTVATTWNCKISSSGVASSSTSSAAYGVCAYTCTLSDGSSGDNGQAVISIYKRYSSTQTGTVNGTYTMRVYGVKLYDIIGG